MRDLFVPVTVDGKERPQLERIYTPDELPLLDLMLNCKESTTRSRKRPGHEKYYKVHYLEIPCAFDIETTNICRRTKEGRVDPEYRPYAYMYHWQMCIGTYVTFGRTWEEWLHALDVIRDRMHLSDDTRLVIWVHNLPFEFQFFRRFVTVTEGFYKEPYKPLKVVIDGGIEFRDSLALSNMSLEQFCKNSAGCIHWKAEGDLDYNQIRTAATPLSGKELGYCFNDVAGLSECIAARMKEDTLAGMPMTSTGYVRRDCRNEMRKNRNNRRMFKETALRIKDPDTGSWDYTLYKMFSEAFRGGNTHANAAMANMTIKGPIYSYDITSSYPAVIMEEYMPMGAFCPYPWEEQKENDPKMDKYCYIFQILIKDPVYIGTCGIPYISVSKCSHITEGPDYQEDNGRIRRAEFLEMTILEIDWKIIKKTYDMTNFWIRNMYAAKRGQLPAEFKNVVMEYFRQKTRLKGLEDPDSVYLYGKYKSLLNACFGMTTTRPDMDLILYEENTDPEYKAEGKSMETLLNKFYNGRNSFLPYQWGVYHCSCPRSP